jgi:hypothetical protein
MYFPVNPRCILILAALPRVYKLHNHTQDTHTSHCPPCDSRVAHAHSRGHAYARFLFYIEDISSFISFRKGQKLGTVLRMSEVSKQALNPLGASV